MVDRTRARAVFLAVVMLLSVVAACGTAAAPPAATGADAAMGGTSPTDPVAALDERGVRPVEQSDNGSGDLDRDDPDVEVHQLTLISGHTIEVLEDGERTRVSLEKTENAEELEVVASERQGSYVVPEDVNFDVVSKDLFNVELLLEQGLADDETDGIPVIVTYEDAAASLGGSSTSISGLDLDTEYEIIDGAAGTIGKDDAGAAMADAASSPAVDRVHLDYRDEVRMDDARERTNVGDAWTQYNVTGEGQTIAILDTGVDADHPDFGDRVVDRVDFSGDGLGDPNGHGTHVAGIAAGGGNLSNGTYAGVAPEAEIMDVKVLGDSGTGFRSDIIEGIEYAVDNDADVVSMSLGGPVSEDDPYAEAISNARDAGIPVVASAGNSGPDFETVGSPAAVADAIAVGSSDDSQYFIEYSSVGPAPFTYAMKPEISAPGTGITATGSGSAGEAPYTEKTGTSMAAPHVSGLIALLEDHRGNLSVSTIENRLVSTADMAEDRRIYKQGGGEANATAMIGSDVVVRDAVNGFGLYSGPNTDGDVVAVENLGNETREFDVEASLTNEESGESLDDQVSVNETSVTVAPGETEYVSFEFDTEDAYGYNAGTIEFDGATRDYHAVFGFTTATEVTIEKELRPDSVSPEVSGDFVQVWSEDGEVFHSPLAPSWNGSSHSFLMFTDEATVNVWSSGELEPEDHQLSGDPVQVVKEGVEVSAENSTIHLDENQTVERTVDTGPIADGETHEEFTPNSFEAALYANDDAVTTSYSRSYSGDFGIFSSYVTPVDNGHTTNVSNTWLFAPTDQIDEQVGDADEVYWFFEPTTNVSEDGEAFVVDPEADHVGAEHVEWYRHKEDQLYGFADHVWPTDRQSFPVFFSFAFVSDLHEDVDEQTWYRSTEVASYQETWYDDGSFAGEDNEWRYDRTEPLVLSDGEELDAPFDRSPVFAGASEWSVDDGDMSATVHPYVDQGNETFTPYAFNNDNPNRIRLYVDGDLAADGEFVTSSASVSGENLTGSTVGLMVEGRTIAGTSRESHAVTYYEATIDGGVDTPPAIETVAIDDLDLDNERADGVAELRVEVSQHADADTLDAFSAYYAGGDVGHTPFNETDGWSAADVEHLGGTEYAVAVPVDAAEGLSLAFEATDETGNLVRATSYDVANWAEGPVTPVSGQPERIDGGDDIEVTLDADGLEEIKTELHPDSTVDEDELTLYQGSSVNAFGEWRAYEPPLDDADYPVIVDTEDDTVGSVVLEHTFRGANDTETTVVTGPTAVYDEPLVVGDSANATVPTIQEAVDLAPTNTTIYVENGTYEETVHVETDGLTIRPVDGAEPSVVAPANASAAFHMAGAHNVTLEGLAVDAGGADGVVVTDDAVDPSVQAPTVSAVHVENAATAVAFEDAVDPTVTDVTVEDAATGVSFAEAIEPHASDVTATDVGQGVAFAGATGAYAEGVTAEGVDVGVAVAGATDLTLTNATVTDASVDAVQAVGADASVSVSGLAATDVQRGVHVAGGAHANATESVVTNASVGLRVATDATVDATLNEFDVDTGVQVDDGDAAGVTVHHNDFSGSDLVAETTTDQPVDLRLNYVGDRAGGEAIVAGDVVYDPFLTSVPETVDEDRTDIGTDLQLESGTTYTVGVPGPTAQNVSEAFTDFEGAIYAYDAVTDSWTLASGDDDLEALDAFAVVPEEDVRVVMSFEATGETPPAPGAATLEEGWNFVAAPQYNGVENAFGQSTADVGLATGLMASPQSQLGAPSALDGTYEFGGGAGPHVSAFEGVFVFVDESGQQPAYLSSDASLEQLYAELGLDPALDDGSDDDADESTSRSLSDPAIAR